MQHLVPLALSYNICNFAFCRFLRFLSDVVKGTGKMRLSSTSRSSEAAAAEVDAGGRSEGHPPASHRPAGDSRSEDPSDKASSKGPAAASAGGGPKEPSSSAAPIVVNSSQSASAKYVLQWSSRTQTWALEPARYLGRVLPVPDIWQGIGVTNTESIVFW